MLNTAMDYEIGSGQTGDAAPASADTKARMLARLRRPAKPRSCHYPNMRARARAVSADRTSDSGELIQSDTDCASSRADACPRAVVRVSSELIGTESPSPAPYCDARAELPSNFPTRRRQAHDGR